MHSLCCANISIWFQKVNKETSYSWRSHSLETLPTSSKPQTCFFSLEDSPVLDISLEQNHALVCLLSLNSLTEHKCVQGASMWSHVLVHYSSRWVSNIPVYGSDTLYIWWQAFCCFHLWALMKNTARALLNKLFYFFEHILLILFGVHLALKFLEHLINQHPIIWKIVKWFPTVVQNFTFPPTSYKGSNFFTASPRLVIVLFGKIWPPSVYVKKDLMAFFLFACH